MIHSKEKHKPWLGFGLHAEFTVIERSSKLKPVRIWAGWMVWNIMNGLIAIISAIHDCRPSVQIHVFIFGFPFFYLADTWKLTSLYFTSWAFKMAWVTVHLIFHEIWTVTSKLSENTQQFYWHRIRAKGWG